MPNDAMTCLGIIFRQPDTDACCFDLGWYKLEFKFVLLRNLAINACVSFLRRAGFLDGVDVPVVGVK